MAKTTDKRAKFKMRWYHRKPRYWLQRDRPRRPGYREAPEVVRFDAEPGVEPSGKPPVRIFMGSEPLQARAERVFLYSVKAVRDPARAYEIHLMKDLAGFDRNGWTTGFTNYRYAIPALGGEAGRGIYNDVDQIYLADPSEMFDADMKGAAILCVDDSDTSVSLIDCAAMAPHWRPEDAKAGLKRKHFLDIITSRGLFGPLAPVWNARDAEYAADQSKCFHFTTLRTQPWKPFEDQLRYADHPDGEVWFKLERAANAARFNAFTRERPSSRFAGVIAGYTSGAAPSNEVDAGRHGAALRKLAAATGAKSVLDYSAAPSNAASKSWTGLSATPRDVARAPFADAVTGRFDGVVALDVLSGLAEEDVPWALDELFAAGERFVYVAVASDATGESDRSASLPASWWRLQMELAANRTPGRRWALSATDPGGRTTAHRSG